MTSPLSQPLQRPYDLHHLNFLILGPPYPRDAQILGPRAKNSEKLRYFKRKKKGMYTNLECLVSRFLESKPAKTKHDKVKYRIE